MIFKSLILSLHPVSSLSIPGQQRRCAAPSQNISDLTQSCAGKLSSNIFPLQKLLLSSVSNISGVTTSSWSSREQIWPQGPEWCCDNPGAAATPETVRAFTRATWSPTFSYSETGLKVLMQLWTEVAIKNILSTARSLRVTKECLDIKVTVMQTEWRNASPLWNPSKIKCYPDLVNRF